MSNNFSSFKIDIEPAQAYWVTGNGNRTLISNMDDDHILNTIGLLQTRLNNLATVEFVCPTIDRRIEKYEETIEYFVAELNERAGE